MTMPGGNFFWGPKKNVWVGAGFGGFDNASVTTNSRGVRGGAVHPDVTCSAFSLLVVPKLKLSENSRVRRSATSRLARREVSTRQRHDAQTAGPASKKKKTRHTKTLMLSESVAVALDGDGDGDVGCGALRVDLSVARCSCDYSLANATTPI